MNSKNNSYLSIAKNEYEYITNDKLQGFNNIKAFHCQQVCEKLLKHVVSQVCTNVDILRTNKLKRLYDNISTEIMLSKESEDYLSTLSHFYSDTRYPGDDYVDVSDSDLNRSMSVTREIYKKVMEWENKRTPSKSVSELLAAASKTIVNNIVD